MTRYFLGVDVGHTKSHALITDESGAVLGFGKGGSGAHEGEDYTRFRTVVGGVIDQATREAGISTQQISGAGFGIGSYDWPSEREPHLQAIETLGLTCAFEIVNDSIPGLLAGSNRGWGISVVAGTSFNCRGWTPDRREGRVLGFGLHFGEGAGSAELVTKAIQSVGAAWRMSGPPTQLTQAFVDLAGVRSVEKLLEDLTVERCHIGAEAAPLVFRVAAQGDEVAQEAIRWAGRELGSLVLAVCRQLSFQDADFDVVMSGSFFKGGPLVVEALKETVLDEAPHARFIHLTAPPVVGSVLLGMEMAGIGAEAIAVARKALVATRVG